MCILIRDKETLLVSLLFIFVFLSILRSPEFFVVKICEFLIAIVVIKKNYPVQFLLLFSFF